MTWLNLFVPGLLVSGFIVFTPKFIEAQFSLPAGWAAQIVGEYTDYMYSFIQRYSAM